MGSSKNGKQNNTNLRNQGYKDYGDGILIKNDTNERFGDYEDNNSFSYLISIDGKEDHLLGNKKDFNQAMGANLYQNISSYVSKNVYAGKNQEDIASQWRENKELRALSIALGNEFGDTKVVGYINRTIDNFLQQWNEATRS